jgi:spore photoproduct lyase
MKANSLLSPVLKEAIQKGAFVKSCPCSPAAISCGYYNLNLQTGCPFACNYCILQTYLEDKNQAVFFTNYENLEDELRGFIASHQEVRIGTGELSDSLAYESIYPTAARILKLFQRFPNVVFEFKTKATLVQPLLAVKEVPKNIVLSWSLNPPPLIRAEELLTPTLLRRLQALASVQNKGYKIGIHFDPLIIFPNWKKHYHELIRRLASIVRPELVAWWSLGALRFPPALKKYIFRHPNSQLFWGELLQGQDGKYRYFKPLRLELFSFIKAEIKKHITQEIPLYLCMEDADTWQEIFPEIPAAAIAINHYLYETAMRK